MNMINQLALDISLNGQWSKSAMKTGWKWLKADHESLKSILIGMGFEYGTSDYQAAKSHYKQEVEKLIK